MMMSNTQPVHFITFITGQKPDHSHYWAYLAIPTDQYTLYQAAAKLGDFDLEDYAKVLAFGDGVEPPPHIKQQIYQTYKLDDDFHEKLLALRHLADDVF